MNVQIPFKFTFYLLASIIASATVQAITVQDANHAPILPASIHALSGIDPRQQDDSDLAPLDNIVGEAQVVALGEAVHTSGGFHDARFRVVRHLIRDKGFRVLTLESPRFVSQPLIDFIDSCKHAKSVDKDQLHEAMDAMFPIFASETMADMLGWVCQFNAAHPGDAVSFTGFDMQEPKLLGLAATAALSANDVPPSLSAISEDITRCAKKSVRGEVTSELERSCSAVIENELQLLAAPEIAGLSSEQRELLKMNLRSLRANIRMLYLDELGNSSLPAAYQTRDEAMADILLTLDKLYWKNSRVIVWAHNLHIERDGQNDSQPVGPSRGSFKNMGQYLSESLKDHYKAIGLLAYQDEINWPAMGAVCAITDQLRGPDTAEFKLRMLDRPYLIVDTSAMRSNPTSFFAPTSRYAYSQGSKGAISQQFDGLIYLQNSQAMTPVMETACPITPDLPMPTPSKNNNARIGIDATQS
jgi:erythromycin esterase-like protein